MPRVPIVQGTSVEATPLRGGFREAADGNAALRSLAGGLMQSSDALQRVVDRENRDVAFRAETSILTEYDAFEADLRSKSQGRGAAGYADKVAAWWAEQGTKASKNLAPAQQELIRQSMANAQRQSIRAAQNYQQQELDRSELESFTAAQLGRVRRAVATGDPAAAAVASEEVRKANAAWGRSRGWTPEQLDDANLKFTTALHTNLLQALQQRDPQAAAAYFETNKGEIDSTRHAEIEQKLKTASQAAIAQTQGAEIAAKYGYDQTAQAQKHIDSLTALTPEQKVAVRAEVEHRHAQQRADANEADALRLGRLHAMVSQNRSLAEITATPDFQNLRNQGQVLDLIQRRVEHRVQLQAAIESRDWTREQRLRQRIEQEGMAAKFAYMDPAVLVQMSRPEVAALAIRIGEHNTQDLLNRYDALRGSPQKLRAASIDNDQFNTIADEMKLSPFADRKTEGQKRALATAKTRVEAAIDAWQQAHGNQEMPRDQKEVLMRQLIANTIIITEGRLWGTNSTSLATIPKEDLKKIVVPDADRAIIVMNLKKAAAEAGKPDYEPDEIDIKRLYYAREWKKAIDGIR